MPPTASLCFRVSSLVLGCRSCASTTHSSVLGSYPSACTTEDVTCVRLLPHCKPRTRSVQCVGKYGCVDLLYM
uniref:Putative secreted protein n=1 Tax=Ixodes ricinus TaxID=34613 RepID=A0A6B0U2F4_IXORI